MEIDGEIEYLEEFLERIGLDVEIVGARMVVFLDGDGLFGAMLGELVRGRARHGGVSFCIVLRE
jgi:hypothetical protein